MVASGLTSFARAVTYYNDLYRAAQETFYAFERSKGFDLLEREREIRKRAEMFIEVSGLEWSDCGDLERHLSYFKRYLEEDRKQSCASDIKDILIRDLPIALACLTQKTIEENELEIVRHDQDFPAVSSIRETLECFAESSVNAVWQKALRRKRNDPEGAITLARSLLESVCKSILDKQSIEYDPDRMKLAELYKKTADTLNISPSQHTEKVFKQILGSCAGVVSGLGEIRNKLGDAHGKGQISVRPKERHAELAVNLSGSMALYLVETYNNKQR